MSEDRTQARGVEAENPGWQVWRGVGSTGWYARRPLSSPPVVVKAVSAASLREAIAVREAR